MELYELRGHEGLYALIHQIELIVHDQEHRVLNYVLKDGDNTELTILKARSEGANKVLVEFKQFISNLRPKGE